MSFEWHWGHGITLPDGYTIVSSIDFPIYDKDYYLWVHLQMRFLWIFVIQRKVAVHAY